MTCIRYTASKPKPSKKGTPVQLRVSLSDLMDAIDRESEFEDYGYFIDPETGATHFLWDMEADESDDPALFESLSQRSGGFVKLPDRSKTDLFERAEEFIAKKVGDASVAKKLHKALKKARRKNCIPLFLGEVNALGLHQAQLDFWNERDEAFVRQWCAEREIEVVED